MVPSHDAAEQTTSDDTRRDLDHNIRVALAGRAAEALLLGDDAISAAGSEGDLRHASVLATNMFGQWGLSLEIGACHGPASNLYLISEAPGDLEKARIADLVREYLRKQYHLCYAILEKNRSLLRCIADELSTRGFLFQDDFERLWAQ